MARLFFEGNLELLKNKTIGIIGYGNQGRSQALNLRDSGLDVIIGNVRDNYADLAEKDGFKVRSIPEAVKESDFSSILIPDEVAPDVFKSHILPYLKKDHVILFSSGYNIAFNFIDPPAGTDVIMVAPRMIGEGVRKRYEENMGFPVLIGVKQDSSGKALDYALSYSKGIGVMKKGGVAVESSFEEEALVDLFSEHTWAGSMLFLFKECFDALVEEGVSPEVALLELYMSGEVAEIAQRIADMGLFDQLKLHSTTSQYGQFVYGPKYMTDEIKKMLRQAIQEIKDGEFAKDWTLERIAGYPRLNSMWKNVKEYRISKEEEKMRKILKGEKEG
ncbi:ketol-acid reductoisomerase [Candidatus Acidianus copahuensis]|uniref:Ketol-acid reductoisomerase n=1 Tax=Candidatus Acidianus copahuensis TaxID=1160895 RepID=A0A031LW23_9CREN|nr:ketol-acid reductoisomerase [Candidatus Acidianus copahuensis]EZQ11353.1 ketol-acid reductoisomerase [Candidatus Acidianus copahuensis]